MNLPNQSQPVIRSTSTAPVAGGIQASGIACTATCAACNLIPFPANLACKAAAKLAGCDC